MKQAWRSIVVAVVLASPAAAQTDMSSFYSDPSKFMLYGCKQLAQARPQLLYRIQRLEALMGKAAGALGGRAVTSMAYQNDYLTLRGDLRNLDARAADRNCPPMPKHAETPPNEPLIDGMPEPGRR